MADYTTIPALAKRRKHLKIDRYKMAEYLRMNGVKIQDSELDLIEQGARPLPSVEFMLRYTEVCAAAERMLTSSQAIEPASPQPSPAPSHEATLAYMDKRIEQYRAQYVSEIDRQVSQGACPYPSYSDIEVALNNYKSAVEFRKTYVSMLPAEWPNGSADVPFTEYNPIMGADPISPASFSTVTANAKSPAKYTITILETDGAWNVGVNGVREISFAKNAQNFPRVFDFVMGLFEGLTFGGSCQIVDTRKAPDRLFDSFNECGCNSTWLAARGKPTKYNPVEFSAASGPDHDGNQQPL